MNRVSFLSLYMNSVYILLDIIILVIKCYIIHIIHIGLKVLKKVSFCVEIVMFCLKLIFFLLTFFYEVEDFFFFQLLN